MKKIHTIMIRLQAEGETHADAEAKILNAVRGLEAQGVSMAGERRSPLEAMPDED